jgi:hypothetical protein
MAKISRSTQFNPVTLGLLVTAVAAIGLVVTFIHAATPATTPATSSTIACDFNHDGVINDQDLAVVQRYQQQAGDAATGDCTGDGKVDGADLSAILSKMNQ